MSYFNKKRPKVVHLSEVSSGKPLTPGTLIPHPEKPVVAEIGYKGWVALLGEEMWRTRQIAALGDVIVEEDARRLFPQLEGEYVPG